MCAICSDLLFDPSDVWRRRNRRPFRSFEKFFRVCSSLGSPAAPQCIVGPGDLFDPSKAPHQADQPTESGLSSITIPISSSSSLSGASLLSPAATTLVASLTARGILKSLEVDDLGLVSLGTESNNNTTSSNNLNMSSNTNNNSNNNTSDTASLYRQLETLWQPGCSSANNTLIRVISFVLDSLQATTSSSTTQQQQQQLQQLQQPQQPQQLHQDQQPQQPQPELSPLLFVDPNVAIAYAKRYKMSFFVASAKTGQNVKELFFETSDRIVADRKLQQSLASANVVSRQNRRISLDIQMLATQGKSQSQANTTSCVCGSASQNTHLT
eukprot:c11845_g1_i1.p1 GENE.c11845_g1_i1~~c11845_g1_i1.p1  ORF type:complete len:326 (-),score=88.64 c11845_g1_i1:184-1161(-)